jgi:hypothetical protein
MPPRDGTSGRRISRALPVVGLAAFLAVILSGPAVPWDRTSPTSPSSHLSVAASPQACAKPSSVYDFPLANPSSIAKGERIDVTYAFRDLNYTAGRGVGSDVFLPTIIAVFPLASGAKSTVGFQPWNTTISSRGEVYRTHAGTAFAADATFNTAVSAYISSQLIAIQATKMSNFTDWELAFQWRWNITDSLGQVVASSGTWSALGPPVKNCSPIFYPAPRVVLVGTNPPLVKCGSITCAYSTIGTLFSMNITGFTWTQEFWIEFETTGGVVQRGTYTPNFTYVPDKVYSAQLLMNSKDNDLSPGTYLVHLHNFVGALLYSRTVKLNYSTTAQPVGLYNNERCSVTFDAKSYAAGTTIYVFPGSTLHSLSTASTCVGHAFESWAEAPNIDVTDPSSASTSVLVTYSGSVTAKYA